jgi:TRAP-type C4-dicarboxylate transport system permease small subunit
MIKNVARGYALLIAFVRHVANIALVLLVILVASAVVVRYFGLFGGSLHWTDEAARFTMIWLAMLGSVVALDRGAHLAVTLLPDALSPTIQRVVLTISMFSSAVFVVVLAWKGWELSMRTLGQVSPALGVPMGYVYMAIPVAATLMSFQLLTLPFLRRQRAAGSADLTF